MVCYAAFEWRSDTSDGVNERKTMTIKADEFGRAVCNALGVDPNIVAELHMHVRPNEKLQVHLIVNAGESIMGAIDQMPPVEDVELSSIELLKAGV